MQGEIVIIKLTCIAQCIFASGTVTGFTVLGMELNPSNLWSSYLLSPH